jgi:hypothetical protein
MNDFKKVNIYKIINIVLFCIVGIITIGIYEYFNLGYCIDRCSYDFINGFSKPAYSAGKIFAIILGVLLFVPTHIFRRWLFYVAPIIILLTINRVLAVSLYSSSIGSIDKIHMAQLGMYFLGFVTILFVIGHIFYDRRKNKSAQ